MTKIISSPNIDFGLVDEFKSSVVNSKVTNTGTERVTLTDLVSSDERFVLNSFDTRIEPKMPANSTLYFGDNGRIQSATGAYYTTDQGFGVVGTTDENGVCKVYGDSDPEGIVFSDEESFIFTDEEGSLIEDVLFLFSFEDGDGAIDETGAMITDI